MIQRTLSYVVACLFLVPACAPVPVFKASIPSPPTVSTLSPSPTFELPLGTEDEEWARPLERAECVSKDGAIMSVPCPLENGIVLSENKARRCALYTIRYLELVKLRRADLKDQLRYVDLATSQINEANKEIDRLRPNWITQNGVYAAIISGLVIGFSASAAVMR